MAQNEYYLMHHGVKGMKWGVRRTPEQLGWKRAEKGGADVRYINRALKKAYALDRKPNKSSRQSKRQMRIEEELEAYIHTNRNSEKDAALRQAIIREQNRKPSAVQTKLNDPEFQRKAAKAAKIALVIGAAYATHKLVNDPRAMEAGKDAITKVMAKSGAMKASALKSVMNTTEFKAAKAISDAAKSGALSNTAGVKAAKAVAGGTNKVLKKIGSDETRNIVTGIGAMAGTTAILRNQIKDFRENKPDGDAFDRAIKRTQQATEIGENINNLARGPKGIGTPRQSSASSSSSNVSASISGVKPSNKGVDKSSKEYQDLFKGQDATTRSTIKSLVNQGYDIDQIKKHLNHSAVSSNSSGNLMRDSRTGRTVRTNKPLTIKDSKRVSDYQKAHPNKSLEDSLRDLGLLDREYRHSAIQSGWSFNSMAGSRYIF